MDIAESEVFDSHFHIIDPRFPLTPNQGYLPEAFICQDYLQQCAGLRLQGGAVVSGSFQAYDQTYLLDALQQLGDDFVGVTQLPATVTDDEIMALNSQGVRAVRFNLKRGGSESVAHLEGLANRVYDLVGWHVELYVDSSLLDDLYKTLISLPAASIDHLGLSKSGFPTLLKLAEKGIGIKATGFGRVNFDIKSALKDIVSANPNVLMFGTDLPSTRAPRPYCDEDLLLIYDSLPINLCEQVLYKNAQKFYRVSE